jgi:hypothetical protein
MGKQVQKTGQATCLDEVRITKNVCEAERILCRCMLRFSLCYVANSVLVKDVKERVWENFLWHLSFPRVLSRVSL